MVWNKLDLLCCEVGTEKNNRKNVIGSRKEKKSF